MVANIYIDDFIGYAGKKKGITLPDVVAALSLYKGNFESVKLTLIDSPGGDYDIAKDIWAYLSSFSKPIHTHGIGLVASSSSWLYVKGETRTYDAKSFQLMIHNPMVVGMDYADADELDRTSNWIRQAEDEMISTYATQTGQPSDIVKKFMKDETYLDGKIAFDLGFATERPTEIQAVAFKVKQENNKNNYKMSDKKETVWQKLSKAFAGIDIVAMELNTSNGEVIKFLEDKEVYEVGDQATVNGETANGEYIVKNGAEKLTFQNGSLKTIEPVEVEQEDNDVMTEAKIKEIVDGLLSVQATKTDEKIQALETENKKIKKSFKDTEKVFAMLKTIASEQVIDDKEEQKSSTETKKNKSKNQFF